MWAEPLSCVPAGKRVALNRTETTAAPIEFFCPAMIAGMDAPVEWISSRIARKQHFRYRILISSPVG
jgi:hypothetical protein